MIYAHKLKDESGEYIDIAAQRWVVITASCISGKRRDYWQEFESLEAALEEWGLTPYEYPEDETF